MIYKMSLVTVSLSANAPFSALRALFRTLKHATPNSNG